LIIDALPYPQASDVDKIVLEAERIRAALGSAEAGLAAGPAKSSAQWGKIDYQDRTQGWNGKSSFGLGPLNMQDVSMEMNRLRKPW